MYQWLPIALFPTAAKQQLFPRATKFMNYPFVCLQLIVNYIIFINICNIFLSFLTPYSKFVIKHIATHSPISHMILSLSKTFCRRRFPFVVRWYIIYRSVKILSNFMVWRLKRRDRSHQYFTPPSEWIKNDTVYTESIAAHHMIWVFCFVAVDDDNIHTLLFCLCYLQVRKRTEWSV